MMGRPPERLIHLTHCGRTALTARVERHDDRFRVSIDHDQGERGG